MTSVIAGCFRFASGEIPCNRGGRLFTGEREDHTCDFDIAFLDLMLPRVAGEKIDESGKYGLDLLRLIREEEP